MKKFLVVISIVTSVFMFSGCDSSDYLTDEQKAELLSTYYPEIFASIKGDDGDSAYQVAVDNGFTGTVDEWLQSLVGADGEDGTDGVDGVCPDCDGDVTDPSCECYPLADENDTSVNIIAWFSRDDLDGFTYQHYVFEGLTPILVSSHDVIEGGEGNFTQEDCNGTTLIKGSFELDHNQTIEHAIGLQFSQTAPEVEEPVVLPVEDENETI